MNEINIEFEPRSNKDEFKKNLRKTVVCLLISLLGAYLFTSKLNRSGLGENAEISINQIAYIVVFFVLLLYAGFLSIRNLLLSIREYIISNKYEMNILTMVLSAINLISILILIIVKAIFVAGL